MDDVEFRANSNVLQTKVIMDPAFCSYLIPMVKYYCDCGNILAVWRLEILLFEGNPKQCVRPKIDLMYMWGLWMEQLEAKQMEEYRRRRGLPAMK